MTVNTTKNPYKYLGPLNPKKDKLVLIPRTRDLQRVVDGIQEGKFWAVFGSHQTGKTTFLRQIQHRFKNAYHLYMNFEVPPTNTEFFYRWLIDEFKQQIPLKQDQPLEKNWLEYGPEFGFKKFLEEFKPEYSRRKIILLFDEIEKIPDVNGFLHIWRNIYHQKEQTPQLKKYIVILTGAANLLELTAGKNSPFNIAEYLYIKDFSQQESEQMIAKPFEKLKILFEQKARQHLIDQTSGHPLLLQQACYQLVDNVGKKKRGIVMGDVQTAVNNLLKKSAVIDTLRNDINKNKELKSLIIDILKGREKKYFPFKEFSVRGSGPIVEDEHKFCKIRNSVYQKYLMGLLGIDDYESRYEKVEEVGEGGMGVVYRARDALLDRTVAIKKLLGPFIQADDLEKIIVEARTTGKLKHRNIVRVYDVRRLKDAFVIIMEFIDGSNYENILINFNPLPIREILYVAKSVFSALDYSHRYGIIHRDIKPQNIMKDRDNEIKVLDFGIAFLEKGVKKENPGYLIGSPSYMAPEQIQEEHIDQQTDIYSADATLYHLTTGKKPFEGQWEEVLWKHLYENPPAIRDLRKDIPLELGLFIERCMKKKKEERYRSAKEALKSLEQIEESIVAKNTDEDKNDNLAQITQVLPDDYTQKRKVFSTDNQATRKTKPKKGER